MESETKEAESSAKARARRGSERSRGCAPSASDPQSTFDAEQQPRRASWQFTGAPLMTPALKDVHKKEHADINRGATPNCANKDNERGGGGGG